MCVGVLNRDAIRLLIHFFFFSSRRRHTRLQGDWSSDVCSSDLPLRAHILMRSSGMLRTWGYTAEGFECEKITGFRAYSMASRAVRWPTCVQHRDRKSVV